MSDPYEHLTDVELARDLYLATIAPDDEVHDACADKYRPAVKMADALWARLRGPYCEITDCDRPRTEHFPWCVEHLRIEGDRRGWNK